MSNFGQIKKFKGKDTKLKPWDIVVGCLLVASGMAKVGVKLSDIDRQVEQMILDDGGTPYNKGFLGDDDWQKEVKPATPFPNALVVNVNSTVAHGVPTDYEIRDGDTITFDLGVKKDGLCGDAALTVGVGKVENKHERLLRYARLACLKGIEAIKPGVSLADVGGIIEHYVALRGYVVNQTFAGHGIGKEMHEDTVIPNYRREEYENVYFEEGKMYCIEPIITFKDIWAMRAFNDWSWITRDGKRAAMFEHQILVTKTGCKILTKHLF